MLLISFWQVLVFLVAFLSLKQAKKRENFVKSMAMQVKAQIHEESKLWSTS